MADVPKDLLQEIKRLEELFTVDTAKLKSITEHFIKELAKGKKLSTMEGRYVLTFGRFEC
jgi:hexokinase